MAGPLLEWVDCWHLGAAANPRALPVAELRAALEALGTERGLTLNLKEYGGIEEAIAGAGARALTGDCILAFGSFTTVEAVLPSFRARGQGQIALLSSLAAYFGLPVTPCYCASKAAIKAYGEALRGWLSSFGRRGVGMYDQQ